MLEGDPFREQEDVAVAGGTLRVARLGPPPERAGAVVVLVHGITASHAQWRTVVRHLAGRDRTSILAPDLRGRGRSAALPPPYGIDAHVADVLSVLDAVRAPPAVLVGHSMGAYVVARLAAEHPERAAAVILVDGGLPLPYPPDLDVDTVLQAVLGPAIERLHRTFASVEEYVAFWRAHPAFAGRWDSDLEAYVRYDLTGPAGALRSVVVEEAVRADGRDLLRDEATLAAAARVQAPLTIVRAPRGLLDDDNPVIPGPVLDAFAATRDATRVEDIPDVNHYTVVLGAQGGARRVAAVIEAALA